jgi:hypothetical protein
MIVIESEISHDDDDDVFLEYYRIYIHDVYLKYYSGKGFHINYSCLHVLRKTH